MHNYDCRPAIDASKIPSPCFVLDERLLEKNLKILRQVANESGATILGALKGFAMWSTFPLVGKYLGGAAASSLHEARLCYEEMGVKPHVFSPAYLENEFDELAAISSHIMFNSFSQYRRFRNKAMAYGLKMGLRINPEYSEVSTPFYNPCTPGSRLGITSDVFEDELPEDITGLHFHALCEGNAVALENSLRAVEEKFSRFLPKLKWINMGGGHLITEEHYDSDHLIGIIKNFRQKYDVEVFLEPSAAIGWNAGYLVTTVQDIVQAHQISTAILDVSFSAHMPDCLEMPYKPKIWGAVEPGNGKHQYRMGGLTCLAGDFVGDYVFDKPLSVGDKLLFEDMIHYTMVKTNHFNGVNHPSIGIWRKDNSFELIRQFGYEDYKRRLS